MKIIRAKTAGFCMGVSLALKKLDAALDQRGKTGATGRLVTLGPVIHNPRVIADYQRQGVVCINGADEARPGDTVLIRAHGVPREVEEILVAAGAAIVDATCPKVKEAQVAIMSERERNGGTLLLYGEADHPEVRGLVSYAGNDANVFLNLEELESVELDSDRKYFLAAQTTQDITGFANVCAKVKERLGYCVPILETICSATRKRQAEVLSLTRKVDAIVVVGGTNSGNTRRLADVAEGQGIPAVRIEDAAELSEELFAGVSAVGLTAGASTPAAHIDAVEEWLRHSGLCYTGRDSNNE